MAESVQLQDLLRPRPLEEWHDDLGDALWWKFPIDEPPYCGSPLSIDWPGDHTHWTPIPLPTAPGEPSGGNGAHRLSCWFGLSYSSFLILPRLLMEDMPDAWQGSMAELLEQWNDTWREWPDGWGARAQLTVNGRLSKWPSWVLDYRHPDAGEISKLRGAVS